MFPPQCEFFDELEDYIFVKKLYYIGCIDMVFPQCDFFSDIHHVISMQKLYYTGSMDTTFLQCEFFDGLSHWWYWYHLSSLMNFEIIFL